MFNFFNMLGNYDNRKVDKYEKDDLLVSTVECNDGDKAFETAICHPFYNDDKHVIVEAYNTKQLAQEGHDKWVKVMTTTKPDFLEDCQNASISKYMNNIKFYRKEK